MSVAKFAGSYAKSGISRFHMPGHKGTVIHGLEPLDLTEIKGADFLFDPDGIILESERRTSAAFGSAVTCYSAEGSSLSIKAALCAVRQLFGRDIKVAAARNCHRAFVSACTLLDIDPIWLPADSRKALCECAVTAETVEKVLSSEPADAVYITSPDYLGSVADISAISAVCKKHGALLICDNAHGAYLRFLEKSLHPLDLGADIVCDSAHKTLPVYTGGAYLHLSKTASPELANLLKPAMALFGSTSPSYLIIESLDLCSYSLSGELPKMIRKCCRRTADVKALMHKKGIRDISAEPLKITVDAERCGYSGDELAEIFRSHKIECEYSDPAAVVLMTSPYNSEEDFKRLENCISTLELLKPINSGEDMSFTVPEKAATLRYAMLSKCRKIPSAEAEGCICARSAMSCQPSVAVVMAGERIDREIVRLLIKYGIDEIEVL
ncbi:MAG: PLP-dependent transferase [Oscillospiraceae bacterium]